MPSHYQKEILPHTPAQLFELVADVERYPEFLPWCKAARIIEKGEGEIIAELVISYKQFSEKYTSRIKLNENSEIDVTAIKGPFKHLHNNWKFFPSGESACTLEFQLDFELNSYLLEKLIGIFFHRATQKMVSAFKTRADELYQT